MTQYHVETFEEFLGRMHMADEPWTLDDALPDAFDGWLGSLQVELIMAYAEKWHLEQVLAQLK